MNPSDCSVVVVHGHTTDPSTISLLRGVYGNVTIAETTNDALETLQQRKGSTGSTLLLIDIDPMAPSESKCLYVLRSVVHCLKDSALANVVPIVYSSNESPHFMLACQNAGAADYVLKPLHEKDAKTLFLNVQRCCSNEVESSCNGSAGSMWIKFQDRLKSVFQREDSISRKMVDFYTPEPSLRRSSMQSISSDRKDYLRGQLSSWSFQPFDMDEHDLVQCVFMMLEQALSLPELGHLRPSNDDMYEFIFGISNAYHRNNPYHNFRHAVDVMQATYYFLCRIGRLELMDGLRRTKRRKGIPRSATSVADLLRPLDVLALLMASIGHDVGHPGVNNMFMINSGTPLAVMYNDRSVLESFHSMAFFNLLKRHCFHPLTDNRKYPEYAMFRRIIVNGILATDMSLHDEYVQRIRGQYERVQSNPIDLNDEAQCNEERILLCGALIKCADISNCARPFGVAERWACVLAEEFFQQGDLEKELGMSVMPINDRGKIQLEDFQLTFKRNIALKLFAAVANVESSMSFTLDHIDSNIKCWETRKNSRATEKAQFE